MRISVYQSRLYRAQVAAENMEGNLPDDVPMLGNPLDDKVEVKQAEDGSIHAESYGSRITTIAGLVASSKVDLTKYNIKAPEVRKWDVVLKHPQTGEATIVEAFYLRVKFEPKIIEMSRLDIRPVFFTAKLPAREKIKKSAVKRGLVITDTQFGFRRINGKLDPFHDRAAIDVALQIAQSYHFDRVTHLGDIADFSEMSDKFVREPGFYFTTQPAIFEAHWWLQQFVRATPNAEFDALEGNHDIRLQLMLMNHALSLHGLQAAGNLQMPVMSVPNLLSLNELGIRYIDGYPNNETYQGPVRIIHGDIARNGLGATAGALAGQAQEPTVQGHIHRIETASKTTNYRGQIKPLQAVSPGCLCRIDYVVPGHKRGQQWQQGIAVIEWSEDKARIDTIPIVDGVAIYDGQVFTARDRLADLNADTANVRAGWEF